MAIVIAAGVLLLLSLIHSFLLILLFLFFRLSFSFLDLTSTVVFSHLQLSKQMRSTMASRRGDRIPLALVSSYVFDWIVIVYVPPPLVAVLVPHSDR